jgi:hypothetical protein
VVARHRRLEHREALAIDLASDQRSRIEPMRPPPQVDQRCHRRARAVQLDLLGHDLDRAGQLIATFFAQHPDFSWALSTHRAHHFISLSSARSPGSLAMSEPAWTRDPGGSPSHERTPHAVRWRSRSAECCASDAQRMRNTTLHRSAMNATPRDAARVVRLEVSPLAGTSRGQGLTDRLQSRRAMRGPRRTAHARRPAVVFCGGQRRSFRSQWQS